MRKIYTICGTLLIFSIIGLLYWYSAPTMSDDLMYHFVWQEDWQQPLKHIESLKDVITSQITHYFHTNGRSINHTLAQIVINFVPPKISAIINTFMFLLLIVLISIYTTSNKDNIFITGVLSFGLLFIFIKDFGSGFIWLLGTIVYMWVLVFNTFFLIMLRWIDNKKISWKLLPLVIISFFIGWSHEAISLPLSIGFVAYMVLNIKGILQRTNTYCMLAYIAGMMMIVCSPALWSRTNIEGITLGSRIFSGCLNLVFSIRISWLLVLTLTIILLRSKETFINIIRKRIILFIAWITAIGIVFLCGINGDRISICADFLALLLVMSIWQGKFLQKHQPILFISIGILSILIAIPAIKLNYLNYQYYLYHKSQLENDNNYVIKVKQLPSDSSSLIKLLYKRYVNPTVEFNFYNCYMAFDRNDINNKALAYQYNKDYVILLPEDIVDNIYNGAFLNNKLYTDNHNNLFIYKLKQRNEKVNKVVFKLGKEVELKFYQYLLSYRDNEYELDKFNYETININNNEYLVMTIPTSNIRRRIKEIHIK